MSTINLSAPTSKILWEPTPKQEVMLESTADYMLFGGSRGGGKTDAAIRWLLYDIDEPLLRGLVIRRNAKDLTDFVDRAYIAWKPYGVRKTGNPAKFTFPSGAVIYTGHLGTPTAYAAYQGHEYQRILIEEVTHIPTQLLFEQLMGSLRSTIPGIHAQFLGTTNPGGPGHEWVKEYWRIADPEIENGVKFEVDDEDDEDGLKKVTRIFVPANIEENRHLADKDPKYVKFLKNLPPDLRAKWYEGSWEDIDTENQYYSLRLTNSKKAGRITSIPIEPALRTFASLDLGVKDNMVLWIWQVHGMEIRIINCYANRNQPLKHFSDYLYYMRDKHGITIEKIFVPHDANVRSMTSDTLMTRYEKLVSLGHNVEMAPNVGRDDGIDAARYLLDTCFFDAIGCGALKPTEEELSRNFNGDHKGLQALRAYQKEFDEKMNRYKDTPLHDWASDYADSFRYMALSIPTIGSGQISPVVKMQRDRYSGKTNKRRYRR